MLLWIIPFILPMVFVSWMLSAWVEGARWGALTYAATETSAEASTVKPQAPMAAPTEANAESESLPAVMQVFIAAGICMLSLNFTIAMPSSEQIMIAVGGTTFLSGVCIGAYPVGSIICLPLILHFSRTSYKSGVIFLATVAVLGNIAYAIAGSAHGSGAILGMILARTFCGLEGSSMILFSNAIVQLSSGAQTAKASASMICFSCLGLAAGPGLSSASQMLFPNTPPEIPPSLLMVLFAGTYGIAGALYVPSQEQIFERKGSSEGQAPASAPEAGAARTDVEVREAWLHLAVQCIVFACRLFQRVAWEMGALLVLERSFGFSAKMAGFMVALPVLGSLPLLLAPGFLHSLGPLSATHLLSFVELVGIALMFRVDLPGVWPCALFMIGSWLFYGANWASCMPFAPLRAKYALKGHWLLSVETASCTIWTAGFIGTSFGPILSRAVVGECTSPNMLAAVSLAAWAGACLAVEVGLHVLLRKKDT